MNPILINVPMQFETERLILRAPRPTVDSAIVNKAIENSINELRMWLPFAQTLPNIEETEKNLRVAHINFLQRDSFRFLIFNKQTNNFIGGASLEDVNWDIPKCHIGYWITTKYSGNGYMLEAVKGLVDLGFNLEGILINEDLSADDSQLTDTCIYAKVST